MFEIRRVLPFRPLRVFIDQKNSSQKLPVRDTRPMTQPVKGQAFSLGAWSNGCDDCWRQPPADPVSLAYCQTCKSTPCCKSACCQVKRMRSAPLPPRTPAPSGHVSIHSVEAGSTCQALFADERLVPGRGEAGTRCGQNSEEGPPDVVGVPGAAATSKGDIKGTCQALFANERRVPGRKLIKKITI